MQAARSRILTSKSSNCSMTSSQMLLPKWEEIEINRNQWIIIIKYGHNDWNMDRKKRTESTQWWGLLTKDLSWMWLLYNQNVACMLLLQLFCVVELSVQSNYDGHPTWVKCSKFFILASTYPPRQAALELDTKMKEARVDGGETERQGEKMSVG